MASDNLVNVTINDESLRRSLRALDLAATDLEPAMRKIAGTLLAETQFNFLDEGVRGGLLTGSAGARRANAAGYRASDGVGINRP